MFLTKEIINLNQPASIKLANLLAKNIDCGIIFLQGNLGAGKTFLVQNWLKSLGFEGKVKSPTFSLVENYQINNLTIYHLDLYRLNCAQELEFLGVLDDLNSKNLCLIEWAENGANCLPKPDLIIQIEINHNLRSYILKACSDLSHNFLVSLSL